MTTLLYPMEGLDEKRWTRMTKYKLIGEVVEVAVAAIASASLSKSSERLYLYTACGKSLEWEELDYFAS